MLLPTRVSVTTIKMEVIAVLFRFKIKSCNRYEFPLVQYDKSHWDTNSVTGFMLRPFRLYSSVIQYVCENGLLGKRKLSRYMQYIMCAATEMALS